MNPAMIAFISTESDETSVSDVSPLGQNESIITAADAVKTIGELLLARVKCGSLALDDLVFLDTMPQQETEPSYPVHRSWDVVGDSSKGECSWRCEIAGSSSSQLDPSKAWEWASSFSSGEPPPTPTRKEKKLQAAPGEEAAGGTSFAEKKDLTAELADIDYARTAEAEALTTALYAVCGRPHAWRAPSLRRPCHQASKASVSAELLTLATEVHKKPMAYLLPSTSTAPSKGRRDSRVRSRGRAEEVFGRCGGRHAVLQMICRLDVRAPMPSRRSFLLVRVLAVRTTRPRSRASGTRPWRLVRWSSCRRRR